MEDLTKPIVELFCSCFCQQLGNNVELDKNVSTLTREMAQLRASREQLQHRVDYAEGRLRLARTPAVARWLESVDNLEEGVAAGMEGELQAVKQPLLHWWHGPCRCWERYQLSSRVAAMLRDLRYLEKHAVFDVVAERPRSAPPSSAAVPVASTPFLFLSGEDKKGSKLI